VSVIFIVIILVFTEHTGKLTVPRSCMQCAAPFSRLREANGHIFW